jgi:sigma-B regulation protein RsbU (phosphoserine phosphatase)
MSTSEELESRHSRFELKALLDTSLLLIESHDFNFIINNLLLNVMGKMMITKAAVLIEHPAKKNTFVVTQLKGRSQLKTDDEFSWRPEPSQKLETVHHYEEQSVPDEFPEVFKEDKFCTVVDLKTSNQYMGYICLGSKMNGKSLSVREQEFISGLSIISSVAIANSNLFDDLKTANRELDRKVQELHTLFDLSKEFNATVDRDQILNIFKFALLGQMFVRSFFLILDRDGEQTTILRHGIKSDLPEKTVSDLFNYVDQQQFVKDQVEERFPLLSRERIQVLLPLRLQDEKLAVIAIGERANREHFTNSDLNFLNSLGNVLLLSIQKTYLLEERIEKERIEKELNIARTIQKRLLPAEVPKLNHFDVAAHNFPSRQVGGDYYDIITRPNPDEHVIAIADVTGKGIPASLIMANVQAMLHLLAPTELSLEEQTGKVNDIIYKNTPPDIFVTFFWGILSELDSTFHYVNAGHNPPLLLRKNTDYFEELDQGGVILGVVQTMTPYQSDTVTIRKDDILVMYTDGVTEAMDLDDVEYDTPRLEACIKRNRHQSADEIMQAIISDVNTHCHHQLGDDLTMVVIKGVD